MKSYYTIGETAKLLGVTTQTLRHYEKIGILQPRKIDSHTGYRYYSFDQFHIIDRVKYLQGLGLHLNEIGQIIKTKDRCRPSACPKKEWQKSLLRELEQIQNRIKDIEWYIEYFTYLSKIDDSSILYHLHLPERHIIPYLLLYRRPRPIWKSAWRKPKFFPVSITYLTGDNMDIFFLFRFVRQPFSSYTRYFIYLKHRRISIFQNIKVLPANTFPFAQILKEHWDTTLLHNFFL